ncbi:MAG: tetratricopeptide repeat protein [Clostridiales bacterium]|jgi:tetratricopeptide (TPR) repeat protein|nr:tetratricopeptide repeat protein [Clostridiales bacterium]
MRRVISLALALMAMLTACSKPLNEMTAAELLDLGEKYLLEMNYEQAVVYFGRLIEIEPKNPRGYTGAADAYAGLGQPDKAKEVLKRGLERLPDDAGIRDKLSELDKLSEPPRNSNDNINADTASGGFVLPDNIASYMEDLYNAFVSGDMNLAYNLMTDENAHSWFSQLDHKTDIYYNAGSGHVSSSEREDYDDYYYHAMFYYFRSDSESEPRLTLEHQLSRNEPGERNLMAQYGKRENGFVYHIAWTHQYNGDARQFTWEDLTYQDGKATGAFKRYAFNPQSGDIFSYYWQVQSGNVIDGFYEGDVFEERHSVYEGIEQQVDTWMSRYADGILQPLGAADAEGNIPYAAFVSGTWGTPDSVLPNTRPAGDTEWEIHRPYEAVGLF